MAEIARVLEADGHRPRGNGRTKGDGKRWPRSTLSKILEDAYAPGNEEHYDDALEAWEEVKGSWGDLIL